MKTIKQIPEIDHPKARRLYLEIIKATSLCALRSRCRLEKLRHWAGRWFSVRVSRASRVVFQWINNRAIDVAFSHHYR